MTDPQQLYAQLVAVFNRGHWREAQRLAEQLLPLAPRHPGVYSLAGRICMELRQMPQAVDYLQRAAEMDPTRADFATLHAKALSMQGLPGAAEFAADCAIALSPDDAMTLDTLGVIYTRSQAHHKAAAASSATPSSLRRTWFPVVSITPAHSSLQATLRRPKANSRPVSHWLRTTGTRTCRWPSCADRRRPAITSSDCSHCWRSMAMTLRRAPA